MLNWAFGGSSTNDTDTKHDDDDQIVNMNEDYNNNNESDEAEWVVVDNTDKIKTISTPEDWMLLDAISSSGEARGNNTQSSKNTVSQKKTEPPKQSLTSKSNTDDNTNTGEMKFDSNYYSHQPDAVNMKKTMQYNDNYYQHDNSRSPSTFQKGDSKNVNISDIKKSNNHNQNQNDNHNRNRNRNRNHNHNHNNIGTNVIKKPDQNSNTDLSIGIAKNKTVNHQLQIDGDNKKIQTSENLKKEKAPPQSVVNKTAKVQSEKNSKKKSVTSTDNRISTTRKLTTTSLLPPMARNVRTKNNKSVTGKANVSHLVDICNTKKQEICCK